MRALPPGAAGFAVPAYAHPVLAPQAWRRLATLDLGGGFVVLNAADGPGDVIDPTYVAAVEPLHDNGSTVCGYLDTGYGRRPVATVLAEARRYRDWYGVTSVFVDQVASGADAVPYCTQLVRALRDAGAATVVLNPGVVPDPGTAVLGDVVVTFEGTWQQHRAHRSPPWVGQLLARTAVCHLVHSVPRRAALARVVARAGAAGAGIVGLSSAGAPNPWCMADDWAA